MINMIEKKEKDKKAPPAEITKFEGYFEFLSNEYNCKVEYDNYVFQSASALFYAFKAKTQGAFMKFQRLSPLKAKSKSQKLEYNEDYEKNKKYYLKKAVNAKFTSNPDLKLRLLKTGNTILVNTITHLDTWIGVKNNIGENMLGKVLMELRSQYFEERKNNNEFA